MNYKKAVEARLIRGRSIEGVAASLYAACRQCKNPRTLDEIGGGQSNRKEGDRSDLQIHGQRA